MLNRLLKAARNLDGKSHDTDRSNSLIAIEDRNRSCDPRSYLQHSRKRSREHVERYRTTISITADEPLLKDEALRGISCL